MKRLHLSAIFSCTLALAGCSGGALGGNSAPPAVIASQQRAPGGALQLAAPSAGVQALIYACGPVASVVDIYPVKGKNPQPIGTITNGVNIPTGLTVDRAGNLYVDNNSGNSVTVYKKGQTTPSLTYTDSVSNPVDVAAGPDGTVYIANFGSGHVTVYPPKSTTMSRTLVAPSGGQSIGLALDDAGDLFVSYVTATTGLIYEYLPGATTGTDLGITFSATPHGLAIDGSGNLLVAVSAAPSPGSSIEVFPPGSKTPSMTIAGVVQPFMLALSHLERRLFVADFGTGNNDGAVLEFTYPGGKLVKKDTQGAAASAYGVAVVPGDNT